MSAILSICNRLWLNMKTEKLSCSNETTPTIIAVKTMNSEWRPVSDWQLPATQMAPAMRTTLMTRMKRTFSRQPRDIISPANETRLTNTIAAINSYTEHHPKYIRNLLLFNRRISNTLSRAGRDPDRGAFANSSCLRAAPAKVHPRRWKYLSTSAIYQPNKMRCNRQTQWRWQRRMTSVRQITNSWAKLKVLICLWSRWKWWSSQTPLHRGAPQPTPTRAPL